MRLSAIKEGDIVQVGSALHAKVIGKPRRGLLLVQGICAGNIVRARADEIVVHWRQVVKRAPS